MIDWIEVQADLMTNAAVRDLCKISTRGTLIRWREHENFPQPVIVIDVGRPHPAELWSRTAVLDWLARRQT